MQTNLSLLLAERRVSTYSQAAQRGWESSPDRLEVIQQGLDSLRWLQAAEATMRAAAMDGLIDFDEECRRSVDELYAEWLALAESQFRQFDAGTAGSVVETKFAAAVDLVRERMQLADWRERTAQARSSAWADEEW